MGKVANCITMASLLANNRKYNIEELASHLEVTPRMIRVYKDELEKCGIFIDTIRGPYGGYILNQTIRIPNRKFNYSDVKLLEDLNQNIQNEDLKNQLIVLIDKVRGIYFDSKEEKKELNLENETLSKYNLLTRAIKEKRKVKILYYSFDNGENERIIHPLDMFLYETGWGIAAFCENKQDLRNFELKRIRKYELLDKNF